MHTRLAIRRVHALYAKLGHNRLRLAKACGVAESTLRRFPLPTWDPRATTLQRLEEGADRHGIPMAPEEVPARAAE